MTVSNMSAGAGAWNTSDVASRAGALDQRFALDVQGVDALRRTVRASPEEGLQQVSRQFEAMFMNMVLKSMREATPSSGMLDSQSQKVYQSMFDQQLAQNLSGRGVGLAEAMLEQLRRTLPSGPPDAEADAEIGIRPMLLEPRASGLPLSPGVSPRRPTWACTSTAASAVRRQRMLRCRARSTSSWAAWALPRRWPARPAACPRR